MQIMNIEEIIADQKFNEAPWGTWQVLDDSEEYKVKKVVVKPGKRLSYQKHFKREETWMIVQGEALVTLDGVEHKLQPGDSIFVAKEAAHRIANPEGSSIDMVFIEIQRGEYFGEDDIVRFEDDYGRK